MSRRHYPNEKDRKLEKEQRDLDQEEKLMVADHITYAAWCHRQNIEATDRLLALLKEHHGDHNASL